MIIVAIDPGVEGALSVFNGGNLIGIEDLPVLDGVVQAKALLEMINDIAPDLIVCEDTQPMPKNGSIASYKLGLNTGIIRAVALCSYRALERVKPVAWKRNLGLIGTNKDRALLMANELYPSWADHLRLKKHHNRADAVLIGRWAVGQHVFKENADG